MARVIVLRRGRHTFVGKYRTNAELCAIVLSWALDERFDFRMRDAAAILESCGVPCELVQ